MNLSSQNTRLYCMAFTLEVATILFAFIEGIVSVFFGFQEESFTLFGFGIGSFIEVISGISVAYMVVRIMKKPDSNRQDFERIALRITGISFYILVAGLIISSIYNLWTGHNPQNTLAGIIIALVSITIMAALVYGKTKVGKGLNSKAIMADAECTKVCIYMSLVLLAASGIYSITKVGYVDSIGAMAIAYLSFKEGRECFDKAENNHHCSCED